MKYAQLKREGRVLRSIGWCLSTGCRLLRLATLTVGLMLPGAESSASTSDDEAFRRAIEGGNAPQSTNKAVPNSRPRKVQRKALVPKEACDVAFARLSGEMERIDKFYLQKCFYDERCDPVEKCVWYRQGYEYHSRLRDIAGVCKALSNHEQEFARYSNAVNGDPYIPKCVRQR